jgi:PAS domain S-box-containing protein
LEQTGRSCGANQAELDLLGYSREEYLGHHIAEFHADQEAIKDILYRLSHKQTLHDYEARLRHKDGSIRSVLITSNVRWDQERFLHTRCFTRDITERKQMEGEREELLAREQTARRQAEEASRMKDEFLATVSHELRTPLNAILGWASVLQMNLADPGATTQAAETIERNARAQNQLIDDLLDISRIITGRMRLEVQSVDVPLIIQAAVNAIRPAAEAKDIRLQVVLDPNVGMVSGDPSRLQQIVWNLLTNAVKFTPKKGRIQVHLERINSHVEITVSDTGRGISPQFLPFVFDRFRQADSSFTRTHGGLGLGLSIVRQLVELHGGTVEAKSEGEGHGATFAVKLPIRISKELGRYTGTLESAEAPIQSDPSTPLPSLANLKLLIVEDEADARELLITILKECGADVQAVSTAAEGLTMLKEWEPDVLISDIEMPYEDGFSLIGKVRALADEEGGQIPAIALTAHVRDVDRLEALASGFDAHVGKPMEPLELITVIANLARRNRTGSRKS